MSRYLVRRLVAAILVILGATAISYGLMNLAPGSPVDALVDPMAGAEVRERKRAELGLDKPVYIRYAIWLREVARGNLGYSFADYRPVAQRIRERFWATAALVLISMAASTILAIVLGVVSAVRPYSFWNHTASVIGLLGVSLPGFFLGMGAIYVFSLKLRILPSGGMLSIGSEFTLADFFAHAILPGITLGLFNLGSLVRYVRSGMLEVLNSDFIRTAFAKGLSDHRVIFVHGLRNALIPLITVVAVTVPRLLGGSIVVEQVFVWPGMGRLAIQAILQRDYPILMGINLVVALLVVASSLVTDVLYAYVDPRIRYT